MIKKEICPVVETIKIIGKKWYLIIIYQLLDGPKRFNELLNSIEGISSKTLSQSLSELVKNGLISRKVYTSSPIRVEYCLTEKGKELKELIQAMRKWGERWVVQKGAVG